MVAHAGSGTSSRTFLYADERGSIIAGADSTDVGEFRNAYGPYGEPGASNQGAFQYTGQLWLAEIGFHHFKARVYNHGAGRFMQPDPIGYGDGMNMYAYVGGDPINATDPRGTDGCDLGRADTCGSRIASLGFGGAPGFRQRFPVGDGVPPGYSDCVVIAGKSTRLCTPIGGANSAITPFGIFEGESDVGSSEDDPSECNLLTKIGNEFVQAGNAGSLAGGIAIIGGFSVAVSPAGSVPQVRFLAAFTGFLGGLSVQASTVAITVGGLFQGVGSGDFSAARSGATSLGIGVIGRASSVTSQILLGASRQEAQIGVGLATAGIAAFNLISQEGVIDC